MPNDRIVIDWDDLEPEKPSGRERLVVSLDPEMPVREQTAAPIPAGPSQERAANPNTSFRPVETASPGLPDPASTPGAIGASAPPAPPVAASYLPPVAPAPDQEGKGWSKGVCIILIVLLWLAVMLYAMTINRSPFTGRPRFGFLGAMALIFLTPLIWSKRRK